MKPVLVTDGNIGSHVAEGLAAKGVPVRVLVRSVKPNSRWDASGIEQKAGDLNDPGSLDGVFRGVEKFFSVSPFVENLTKLAVNSIDAAKRAGVEYIVRSSALGASESAPIAMGRWHGQVEAYLNQSRIPHTVLQPNAFMQNYLAYGPSIAQRGSFEMPQGNGKVSVVDVRDIAAAAVAVLMGNGHTGTKYAITGGAPLSGEDIAQNLSFVLGRKITYTDVTEDQAGHSMRAGGMPEWMIQALLELFRICKAGYAATVSPAVKQLTGRKPIEFDRFLRDNLLAFTGAAGASGS